MTAILFRQVGLFLAACAFLAAAPMYQIQAVSPAGGWSVATAINASGAVAGSYRLPDGSYRAFVWSDGAASVLPLPSGAVQTWGSAISGSGQAGGYQTGSIETFGAIWSGGTPSTVGPGYVNGLNEAGDAAGLLSTADGGGRAFLTQSGQIIDLGQPAGGSWSAAYGINASGQVAGTAMTATGGFRAFTANSNGTATLLPGLGGANAWATAINGAGVVAGHAQTAASYVQATLWTAGGPTSIGTLGGSNSYGYGVNSSGQVVGYSNLAAGENAAFLYDENQIFDLNGLLMPGTDWRLLAAYGINDRGQIVGVGTHNGQEQAFLLTPVQSSDDGHVPLSAAAVDVPEPGTLLLGGAGMLLLLAMRARHPRR